MILLYSISQEIIGKLLYNNITFPIGIYKEIIMISYRGSIVETPRRKLLYEIVLWVFRVRFSWLVNVYLFPLVYKEN